MHHVADRLEQQHQRHDAPQRAALHRLPPHEARIIVSRNAFRGRGVAGIAQERSLHPAHDRSSIVVVGQLGKRFGCRKLR